MRNIGTFPSKQMYLYLSLVERKVAQFYLNMDGRRYLIWLYELIFIKVWTQVRFVNAVTAGGSVKFLPAV